MVLEENSDWILINEKFPRIGKKLVLNWGYPSFDGEINALLNDTRDGTRQGFPKDVGWALMRLSLLHATEFPSNTDDMWSDAFDPKYFKPAFRRPESC